MKPEYYKEYARWVAASMLIKLTETELDFIGGQIQGLGLDETKAFIEMFAKMPGRDN